MVETEIEEEVMDEETLNNLIEGLGWKFEAYAVDFADNCHKNIKNLRKNLIESRKCFVTVAFSTNIEKHVNLTSLKLKYPLKYYDRKQIRKILDNCILTVKIGLKPMKNKEEMLLAFLSETKSNKKEFNKAIRDEASMQKEEKIKAQIKEEKAEEKARQEKARQEEWKKNLETMKAQENGSERQEQQEPTSENEKDDKLIGRNSENEEILDQEFEEIPANETDKSKKPKKSRK